MREVNGPETQLNYPNIYTFKEVFIFPFLIFYFVAYLKTSFS